MEVLQSPEKVAVISDENRVTDVVNSLQKTVRVAVRGRVGHRGMVLICNWPSEGDAPGM